MENPSSAGGAAPAVSDLRQARAVAGGSRHHRAGHRLGPGLWFRPADYQQGESYRIMYLHVPAAIWSMGIYAAMAVAAFTGLVWQMKMASLAVAAMAPVGRCTPSSHWSPARRGANRCGAPGGCGTRA
ncbi:hypothetical protein SEEN554_17150 [Salmonella enterica subsp. enterica serovar Newport str. CVM 21554]|nr:hypothetical protein SEEN554_17150 [Salmonella enterica subsp. enterica serovar Newport str. CVM 21554]